MFALSISCVPVDTSAGYGTLHTLFCCSAVPLKRHRQKVECNYRRELVCSHYSIMSIAMPHLRVQGPAVLGPCSSWRDALPFGRSLKGIGTAAESLLLLKDPYLIFTTG